MPTRIFQPANSTLLPLIVLLCFESFVQCQIDHDRWSIEQDINRLLSNEDAKIFQEENIQHDSFNGTSLANITSNENATAYWHLSADAPLLEQPTLDAPQSFSSTKQISDSSLKSGTLPFACNHLSILPLRPMLDDFYILPRIQTVLMHLAVGFFYALVLAGYSSRLALASAITTRNSYIPGESLRLHEDLPCTNPSEDKLSPRELLEIPQFTRVQFFDTSSPEANEGDQEDHCVTTTEPVQFIAVYEPIVS
ncbi:hypothetical protein Aperf_G00000067995 [Anoplocephala perfoliata]